MFCRAAPDRARTPPDCPWIHRELTHPGVMLHVSARGTMSSVSIKGGSGFERAEILMFMVPYRRSCRRSPIGGRVCLVVGLCVLVLSAAPLAAQERTSALLPIAYPLSPENAGLQQGLTRVVSRLGMSRAAAEGRLGVALVDLTRGERRAAMINGDRMFYAASLPKIAILLGAFEAIERGQVTSTPRLREQMTQMIRVSNNAAATAVLETVGFPARL